MNDSAAHDELREMLAALALDILDPADQDRMSAHLPGCDECTRTLAEYRQVTGNLGLLMPTRDLDPERSASLRARLIERARGDLPRLRPEVPAPLYGRWTVWALAAGLAGVVVVHHAVHRPLDYGWLVAGVLLIVLVGIGWYASVQRGRLRAIQKRLGAGGRNRAEVRELAPPTPPPADRT